MAEVEDNIYSIEVPEGALYVVFNDNTNRQTADLTIPTDGANCYDYGSNGWTTFSFAADDGTPLTIDVANEADNLVNIGNGQEYYDEDGYILTGSNENASISLYEGCTLTLDNLTAFDLSSLFYDETLNVILKGNNEIKYWLGIYKEDYVFSAVDGGTLNVINTSSEYEAICADVIMNKGALLTVSSTNGLLINNYCDILMADGLTESDCFFVRYDTESEFVPVSDIKTALDGNAYAEIKIDTHQHDLDSYGKCVCGYICPHENITDGTCNDCGLEATFVTITMTDSFGDGWNGNEITIEQLVDGEYKTIAPATIEDGASETFTAILPKDGIYAFSWVKGDYPYECSFTVKVNGETVFETDNCSGYENGEILYVICDHTYINSVCTECGEECEHDWSNKDGV